MKGTVLFISPKPANLNFISVSSISNLLLLKNSVYGFTPLAQRRGYTY